MLLQPCVVNVVTILLQQVCMRELLRRSCNIGQRSESDIFVKLVTSCKRLVPNLLTIWDRQCEHNLFTDLPQVVKFYVCTWIDSNNSIVAIGSSKAIYFSKLTTAIRAATKLRLNEYCSYRSSEILGSRKYSMNPPCFTEHRPKRRGKTERHHPRSSLESKKNELQW